MPGAGPAVFVAVEEDDRAGEVVVMIHDVLEVGERFATLVLGGVPGCGHVVDGVDDVAPSGDSVLLGIWFDCERVCN